MEGENQDLLQGFRSRYHHYVQAVNEAMHSAADSTVLARLGDDLDEYGALVLQVYQSHRGRPTIISEVHSGERGRPRIHIDGDWLRWAYGHRSVQGIADFLGVGRTTVRNALLEYGIADPQQNPFASRAALDEDLDALIRDLRIHFRRAGISMLDGMVRQQGHRVPRERIQQSLLRIDPVRRVFERIRIRRREYHVPGPNSLWHHDGQHGASIHNVRIERLWVDVTAQVGAKWSDFFKQLELHHGLDVNNMSHTWLQHHLFLPLINSELAFFAESWNQHKIQIRRGPNRSPADMFGFDMLVHGVRGDRLPDGYLVSQDDELSTEEEIEAYGVDWDGMQDDRLIASQQANNPLTEGSTSWVGRIGPPDHLNSIIVDPPADPDNAAAVLQQLHHFLLPWSDAADDESLIALWVHGLTFMRMVYGNQL
ncbi:hypothetical protein BV25DRAFT_1872356 [Artomyces pyxidatus]|uniref:Uncharacterized protein n=1 Tax=Artomyces pyxidatus TaxID=48021 RepID=A0ACB8SP14_9AGAM|nr:hypothetical protein BV25DRAFT_1872356 [Artomyces pyxidatus]